MSKEIIFANDTFFLEHIEKIIKKFVEVLDIVQYEIILTMLKAE